MNSINDGNGDNSGHVREYKLNFGGLRILHIPEGTDTTTTRYYIYNDEFNGFPLSKAAIKSLEQTSNILTQEIRKYLNNESFSNKNLSSINQQLIDLEKSFISDKGMYFGSWYRSNYASSDPFSGYAAWILPGLEYEIALKSSDRLYEWDKRYSDAINSLNIKMSALINYLNK